MSGDNLPAEGWYTDPVDSSRERWWNGEKWTDDTRLSAPPSPVYLSPSSENTSLASETVVGMAGNGIASPMMPNRKIGMVDAVKYGFKGYVKWNGRATRSEFWWWTLAVILVTFALNFVAGVVAAVTGFSMVDDYSGGGSNAGAALAGNLIGTIINIIAFVFSVAVFLPSLSLMVRRLHDIGRTAKLAIVTIVLQVVFPVVLFAFLLVSFFATFSALGTPSDPNATTAVIILGIVAGAFTLFMVGWQIFIIVLMAKPTKDIVTQWDNGYRPSVGQE